MSCLDRGIAPSSRVPGRHIDGDGLITPRKVILVKGRGIDLDDGRGGGPGLTIVD